MSPGLLEVAVTLRIWVSLVAPEETPDKFTVWAAAFFLIDTAPTEICAVALHAALPISVNVREMVLLAVPPSLTVTVIVAEPNPKAVGVKLKLPLVFGLV